MILNSLKRQFNNYKNKTYILLLSIECEFMKIINSLDVKQSQVTVVHILLDDDDQKK
jgi:hypothetical protein